jgi:hypothetical protein
MFVRWKRRERVSRKAWKWKAGGPRNWKKETQGTGEFLLVAVLVRSERRDGKPRQKVVAYLGAIAEDGLADFWPRKHFWTAADGRLDALALDPGARQKIKAFLQARVPRPTAEETTVAEEERKKRVLELVQLSIRCGGDPRGLVDLL